MGGWIIWVTIDLIMMIYDVRPPPTMTSAQGIQCDFDDGFCPTWRNVLLAVHNITLASRGELAYTDATVGPQRHTRRLA